LYGVNSLRCRKCRRLTYQSQYKAPAFRLLDRAYKIRKRLGNPGPSSDPLPPKPRHMRWRTYRRLERLVSRLKAEVRVPHRARPPRRGIGRKTRRATLCWKRSSLATRIPTTPISLGLALKKSRSARS
jgi:hypothetical protein